MRVRRVGVVGGLALMLAAAVGGPAAATPGAAGVPVVSAGSVRAAVALPDMSESGHWWFTAWQIPKVWATGARGQGVTVAVVDSGVQASLPELRGVVLPGTDFHGGDGRTDQSAKYGVGQRGHGTAMATMIVGQGGPSGLVGIAPEAEILPVVHQREHHDVARSIRWAVDHDARVINMSYSLSGDCTDDDQAAVRYAVAHGAVVVSGSGNEGAHTERGMGRPTNCLGVLNVAAIDNQMRAWVKSSRGPFVGLAAPGVRILSMDLTGRRGYASGTSDSSALTSGVIALVWSKYPQLTSRQVVARVLATTRDLGAPGRDDVYGYGAARPYQAITAKVPADAPNPVFDLIPAAPSSPTAEPSGTAPNDTAPSGTAPSPPSASPTPSGMSWQLSVVLVVVVVVVFGFGILVAVVLARRHRS